MMNSTTSDAAMDLARACGRGDEVTVKKMIQDGINVNQKTKWGSWPIEHACLAGYPDIVKILLDAGATDESPGYYNYALRCQKYAPFYPWNQNPGVGM